MDKYWLYNTKEFKDSCKICHEFVSELSHPIRLVRLYNMSKTRVLANTNFSSQD